MNKVYEYLTLMLALFGMYNLFLLTEEYIKGNKPDPSIVWLCGGSTIIIYIINKILEKRK